MADYEAYQEGLANHIAAYTTTLTGITSFILHILYVILLFVILNVVFFLVQWLYACLTYRLFYPRDKGKFEGGPIAFGGLMTLVAVPILLVYMFTWSLEIAHSTSEHWHRDVFLLASAPVFVVLALETAGMAILAILVGLYRACCCVCGRSVKKDEECGLVDLMSSSSDVNEGGVEDKSTAAHQECAESDEAGLLAEEEVKKDSRDCQMYKFTTS